MGTLVSIQNSIKLVKSIKHIVVHSDILESSFVMEIIVKLTPKGHIVFFEFWSGSHGMSLQPIFKIFRTSSTL